MNMNNQLKEELLSVYLEQGYDKKYFSYFLEEWEDNLEGIIDIDEQRATELSFEFMKEFMHQLSMGHSVEWAYEYTKEREDIDYPHDVLEKVSESRYYKISENDLMLFAKSQNQGELFEKILMDIRNGEIEPKQLAYDYAVGYVQQYNELLASGHSDIYAEAYLDYENCAEFDCVSPKLYAEIVEEAIRNGMQKEQAEKYANAAVHRNGSQDDVVENAIEAFKKYTENWQQERIIQGTAYAYACRNHLNHEDDYVKLFISEMRSIDDLQNVQKENLYDAEGYALNDYYRGHFNEMPRDWESYSSSEFEGEEDPML